MPLKSSRVWLALALAGCGPVVATDATPSSTGEDSTSGEGLGSEPATAVTQIAAGPAHTCAVLDTGAVRCWGNGLVGKLGYGNEDHVGDDETPASMGDVDVGGVVTMLALGDEHTCALLDTGAVRCWGEGRYGQLGYGNLQDVGDDEVPASIGDVYLGAPAVEIAAGNDRTCARLTTGAVRCWGRGDSGQLGYANRSSIGDDEAPVAAGDVDIGGFAVQVVAGNDHTCALLESGSVRCWGVAYDGQLGYGNGDQIGDDETPASAGDLALAGSVVALAGGAHHTCATLDGGDVQCWGSGANGALGYGNVDHLGDDEPLHSIGTVDVGAAVEDLDAGDFHNCARFEGGAVKCWGNNSLSQLGYADQDTIGDDELPSSAETVDVGGVVVEMALGNGHTCARLETGRIRCWGSSGQYGLLGYPGVSRIGDDEAPASAGDVDLL